jgi:ATP-dependent DNA helicase RecG
LSDIYSGSRFKRINNLCKDTKTKFSYEIDEAGFTFIIHRKKAGEISSNKVNVTVNKMEKLVYQLLSSNTQYTREELAEKTSKTVRTIQSTLNSLCDKEYITRIGSDKTGRWEILK